MFWLTFSIGFAAAVSLLIVVAISIWMWRTRPSRTYVPEYRRRGSAHGYSL